MIKLVQTMYKTRNITNFKTAKTALNLLTSNNDINKFQTLLTTLVEQAELNAEKVKNKTYIKQPKIYY